MSPELESLLNNLNLLKQTLARVLPPEAVDYLINLIAKDSVHRKLLKIVKEE